MGSPWSVELTPRRISHSRNDAAMLGGVQQAVARQRSAGALRPEGAASDNNGTDNNNVHIIMPTTPATHTPVSHWGGWPAIHIVGDLIVVISLLIIFAVLEKVTPRAGYMVFETMYKHSYPYKDNSVPSWSVPVYSIGAPFVAFFVWKVVEWRRKVSWYDWYRCFIAMLFAVFLTAAITNAIKVAIARPRPNFFFQCFPDGKAAYRDANQYGGYPLCVDPDHVAEFRKSFPSGHASFSAAGLGFLTYFLLGQTRTFVLGKARAWAMVVSMIPAIGALIVAISRITDYWHNVSDVCVGLVLGFAIAAISYLMVFPFFSSEYCHVPRYALPENIKARDDGTGTID